MTKLLTLREESEQIMSKKGIYISPYNMAKLSNNAAKILNILTKNNVSMTYQECLITLDIVKACIGEITGEVE